jgi:hypothetical protein
MNSSKTSLVALAAAFALQTSGCEVIAIVLTATSTPDPYYDYDDEEPAVCAASANAYYSASATFASVGDVRIVGVGPLQSFNLAMDDDILFFVELLDVAADPYQSMFSVVGEGVLSDVSWTACYSVPATIVVTHPKKPGKGTLRIWNDSSELESIKVNVFQASDLSVSFDGPTQSVVASLKSEDGTELYGDEFLWEVAPSTVAAASMTTASSLPLNQFSKAHGGDPLDTVITVWYGELSASMTVLSMGDGTWTAK